MAWINPLDRVPQIPQDWANHISQGGLWSLAVMLFVMALGVSQHEASCYAFSLMAFVSVTKKTVDYFKEFESLPVCIGKAIVTVLWPASIYLLS